MATNASRDTPDAVWEASLPASAPAPRPENHRVHWSPHPSLQAPFNTLVLSALCSEPAGASISMRMGPQVLPALRSSPTSAALSGRPARRAHGSSRQPSLCLESSLASVPSSLVRCHLGVAFPHQPCKITHPCFLPLCLSPRPSRCLVFLNGTYHYLTYACVCAPYTCVCACTRTSCASPLPH